jgi:hypothetical protein
MSEEVGSIEEEEDDPPSPRLRRTKEENTEFRMINDKVKITIPSTLVPSIKTKVK